MASPRLEPTQRLSAAAAALRPSPRVPTPSSPAGSAPPPGRWRDTVARQLAFIHRRRQLASAPRSSSVARTLDNTLRQALRRFTALWVAHDNAPSASSIHLHADDDLAGPSSSAPSSASAGRPKSRLPRLAALRPRAVPLGGSGQIAVVLLLLLLVLGLRELAAGSRGSRGFQSARTRRLTPPTVAGRNPWSVLAELDLPRSRFSTRLPGLDKTWKTSAAPVDAFSDARDPGDTTAVVLHWKRTDNVAVILAHLCQYTFFETVLVWNNNPEVTLTHKTFTSARCPAGKLRIYNSPRNLFFLSRYLACAQSSTPYCFFQDDDWVVRPLRSLYSHFKRDPEGPVVVHTNSDVATLYGLEWCFYNHPMHTCFAWVGTGAFTSRVHVERFLSLTGSGPAPYSRDELAHADNSFSTMLNEPPYVLVSALAQLPNPHGHSDGEGIARNKDYIWKGVARLSAHLNMTFAPAPANAGEGGPPSVLTLPSPAALAAYRSPSSLSPPLPAHPYAHHARALCGGGSWSGPDACTFLTNIPLLPPPDSGPFPGPAAVRGGLQQWEEHLGHTARGWKEGGERWSAEEDWARAWSYDRAVDGDPSTVFRSPDVAHTGDYVGLGLLEPLDAAWTPKVSLHVVLAQADQVLRRVRVEVSMDGWHWVRPSGPPRRWTCRRAPLTAAHALTPPDLPFPDSVLLSPPARQRVAEARAAEAAGRSGSVGRWFARQRRRRENGARECTVEVAAGVMPVGATAGGGGGGVAGRAFGGKEEDGDDNDDDGRGGGGGRAALLGAPGWRFVRLVVAPAPASSSSAAGSPAGEFLETGWALAEMWLTAAKATTRKAKARGG